MRRIIILFLLLELVISPVHIFAATTSVTPSTTGDNQISGTTGDDTLWNRGGQTSMGLGRSGSATALHRVLMKFDLSSIPTNAFVTSATLRITCLSQFSTANNAINAYKVLRDWSEGTSADSTFILNTDSSWAYSNYPTQWGTAGADNTSSDRASESSGSVTVGNACSNQNHTLTLATTTVGDWISNPSTNYGLVLIGDEATNNTNKGFGSSENATEGRRPVLSVSYDLAPDTPTSLGASTLVDGTYHNTTTPNLSFLQADDDGADTLQYHLTIDDSSDFGSPVVEYISGLLSQGATAFTVGQAADAGTYLTGSAGQTLSDGNYYWRVLSSDGTASSTVSIANSGSVAFRVDRTAPSIATFSTNPTATSPLSVSMAAQTASDSGEGTVSYRFTEVSGNGGGTSSDWQSSPSYVDDGLLPCTTYEYALDVKDGVGNSTAGGAATVKTHCLGGGAAGAGGVVIPLPGGLPQPVTRPGIAELPTEPGLTPNDEGYSRQLIRLNDSPTVYLLSGGVLRPIVNQDVFQALGLDDRSVQIVASLEEYSVGEMLTHTELPLTTSFVVVDGAGERYLIYNGERYQFKNADIFRSLGFSDASLIRAAGEELEGYPLAQNPIADTVRHPDGTLIKYAGDVRVYLLEGGKKRWIPDEDAFYEWGFTFRNVVQISADEPYDDGLPYDVQVEGYTLDEFVSEVPSGLPGDARRDGRSLLYAAAILLAAGALLVLARVLLRRSS